MNQPVITSPGVPILWRESELAVRLGVHKLTLARLRKAGAIRSVRIGRAVRYSEHAITEYLATHAT
jgi:excisionase family DNA binding protein